MIGVHEWIWEVTIEEQVGRPVQARFFIDFLRYLAACRERRIPTPAWAKGPRVLPPEHVPATLRVRVVNECKSGVEHEPPAPRIVSRPQRRDDFARMVEKTWEPLLRSVKPWLGADAEDVMIGVYVDAHAKWHTLDHETSLLPWLKTTVKWRAGDFQRKQQGACSPNGAPSEDALIALLDGSHDLPDGDDEDVAIGPRTPSSVMVECSDLSSKISDVLWMQLPDSVPDSIGAWARALRDEARDLTSGAQRIAGQIVSVHSWVSKTRMLGSLPDGLDVLKIDDESESVTVSVGGKVETRKLRSIARNGQRLASFKDADGAKVNVDDALGSLRRRFRALMRAIRHAKTCGDMVCEPTPVLQDLPFVDVAPSWDVAPVAHIIEPVVRGRFVIPGKPIDRNVVRSGPPWDRASRAFSAERAQAEREWSRSKRLIRGECAHLMHQPVFDFDQARFAAAVAKKSEQGRSLHAKAA